MAVSLAGHCFRAQHGIFDEPEEVPLPARLQVGHRHGREGSYSGQSSMI